MNSVKNSRSDIWNEEGDVLPLQSHGDIYFASCDLCPEKLLIWGKRPQSARSVLSARVSRKMQSSGCKRCPHCPGGVHTYSVVHNNTWLHTLGRTQLHTVWLKVSTMVAQCCTQPPAVLGVHTFGSRWCLGLNLAGIATLSLLLQTPSATPTPSWGMVDCFEIGATYTADFFANPQLDVP